METSQPFFIALITNINCTNCDGVIIILPGFIFYCFFCAKLSTISTKSENTKGKETEPNSGYPRRLC